VFKDPCQGGYRRVRNNDNKSSPVLDIGEGMSGTVKKSFKDVVMVISESQGEYVEMGEVGKGEIEPQDHAKKGSNKDK
jgi:hypothetical protein